jgi:hypothetical protein
MDQRTHRFLAGANLAAQELFREIDPTLDARVLRVAIPWDRLRRQAVPLVEHHADFPTPCWDAGFLQDLRALGRLEHAVRSAAVVHQRICTAIARCAGAEHFVHFCSPPVPIDGSLACVVLQLRKAAYEAVPRLVDVPQPSHHQVPLSLVDHAISTYLADCPGELQNPATDPVRGWKPATEILREAGWAVAAQAVAVTTGGPMVSDLFSVCTALAATPYEKREILGSMLVSARPHPQVEPVVSLREAVPLTDVHAARKLLQLAGTGLALLCDDHGIYGAGTVTLGDDGHAKNVFTIKFTHPGTWELWHHEQPLMVVSYGHPQVPTPGFPDAEMRQHLARLFGALGPEAHEHLCTLAKAACAQPHGTTFIISSGARQEAERLHHQCFRLRPLPLTPALVPALTDIDGAVLLDVQGTCHAIGVILDGRVSEQGTLVGNRGRGARYNTALRYADDERCPRSLIIVCSDDGMLDFIAGGDRPPPGGASEGRAACRLSGSHGPQMP